MAGNSRRQGARKTPRKGATVGSGGQNKRGLRGKGPTPPAQLRPGHPKANAQQRAAAPAHPAAGAAGRGSRPPTSRPPTSRPPARAAGRAGGRPTTEIVVGRNAVVEALRAGVPASTLYVAARIDADDRVRESLKLAGDRGLAVLEAPRPELDRVTGGALHQGLALQVPAYRYAEPGDLLVRAQDGAEQPLLVALDGVTDPRNLGAVVRSAAAFGAHGVLVPERRAAGMTAGAWKASAGAAARVPVARATNLPRALQDYQRAGLFVVGLDAAGRIGVGDVEVAADPLVLVVGSEGRGLSRLVRERCDLVVNIPMAEDTESLNAGVAAGIALYAIYAARRPHLPR